MTFRALVVALVALLACSPDANGPIATSDPAVSVPSSEMSGGGKKQTKHRRPRRHRREASPSFTILANAAVTCTNGTITGNVGTFQAPGSFTRTTCPMTGTAHLGDAAARRAYNAFLASYTALAPSGVCPIVTGTLAGRSFAPGTYCLSAEAKTGTLTLTGNGTWTFKVAPGAFTGNSFTVVMAGGNPCNVTWWVDAATTMTDSNLKGTILSGAAITLIRGTLIGNAFAKADVTVTGTAVTGCARGGTGKGHGDHEDDDENDDDDDDDDDRDDDDDDGHGDRGHHH